MPHMKTAVLLATLTALFLWAGHALAGQQGFLAALLGAGVMNVVAYWWSDKIVLRMAGAQAVTEAEAPDLYALVRDLARRGGLPLPKVYLMAEDAPNAFATGRNPAHAAVAVTQGLMRLVDREELAAVLAHELGHVQHRDTLVMTVAATIAGAVSMLANLAQWGLLFGGTRAPENGEDRESHPLAGFLGVLLAPLAAALIQAAISRSREFLADAAGAALSRNPRALARALRKIETWSREMPPAAGSPATAHLFIINPLTGGGLLQLFSAHPPTAARVDRLEALVRLGGGELLHG